MPTFLTQIPKEKHFSKKKDIFYSGIKGKSPKPFEMHTLNLLHVEVKLSNVFVSKRLYTWKCSST